MLALFIRFHLIYSSNATYHTSNSQLLARFCGGTMSIRLTPMYDVRYTICFVTLVPWRHTQNVCRKRMVIHYLNTRPPNPTYQRRDDLNLQRCSIWPLSLQSYKCLFGQCNNCRRTLVQGSHTRDPRSACGTAVRLCGQRTDVILITKCRPPQNEIICSRAHLFARNFTLFLSKAGILR
jgi:hypothetical protein